jgi:predicted unusual protein kinase regulating ubiquinone biosynthesis (AarF/ABC1/UbiB family)
LAVAIHICVKKSEFQNVDFEEFYPFLLDSMNLNINEMKENLINLSLKFPDLLDLFLQFQPKLELFQAVEEWILKLVNENSKSNMKHLNHLKEKMKEIEIKFPQYAEDYWMKKISSNIKHFKLHC